MSRSKEKASANSLGNRRESFDDLPHTNNAIKNDKKNACIHPWSLTAATLIAMRRLTETVLHDTYNSVG
jgi:hypothetical protein